MRCGGDRKSEGGSTLDPNFSTLGQGCRNDSAPIGPAAIGFGFVPAFGEERMVQWDFCAADFEVSDFYAEAALVARVG